MPGILYLIPSPLGESDLPEILPKGVAQRIAELSVFVVEHPKTARQFLKIVGTCKPIQEIEFHVLDEHTKDIGILLEPLLKGIDTGLISEAGCPAVADPGADLVALAHRHGIRVKPLVGPSSILLALMASGLGGQRFSFHGYLPVDNEALAQKIRQMEKGAKERDETQIFIETPYRNQKLFDALLSNCRENTRLCIATNITLGTESIMTRTVSEWKRNPIDIGKRPTVFLIKA